MTFRAFVSANNGATATSAGATISLAGGSVGDYALIVIGCSFGGASGNLLPTPSGWTLVESNVDATAGNRAYTFEKTLTSGDISGGVTYAWTTSAGAGTTARHTASGVILVGAHTRVGTSVKSQNSATAASVVTTQNPSTVVALYTNTISSAQAPQITVPNMDANGAKSQTNYAGAVVNYGSGAAYKITGATGTYGAGTLTGQGTSTTYQELAYEVKPAVSNVAPTANAGPDQTAVEPYSTVTLAGSGTDSDGTIASYSWTPPGGITLSSNTAQNPTFTAPGTIAGATYTLTLTVTDNAGATGTDTVAITVLPVTERAVIGGVEVPMRTLAASS